MGWIKLEKERTCGREGKTCFALDLFHERRSSGRAPFRSLILPKAAESQTSNQSIQGI